MRRILRMIQVTENCTDITEAIKVVDIENNAGVVEDDFRDFGCDVIHVSIDGTVYATLVDANRATKKRKITILNKDRSLILTGNVLICKPVAQNLSSLLDDDIINIHRHIREMRNLSDRTCCYVIECDNMK